MLCAHPVTPAPIRVRRTRRSSRSELGGLPGLLLLLTLAAAMPVGAASVSPSWWWNSPSDAGWTNRPGEEVRRLAEGGDATARYYWGRACFMGLGRERDVAEAFRWTRLAADQNHADAQYVVARFHYWGILDRRDVGEGFRWLRRAAGQDHAEAMGFLGRAYQFGEGTDRSATNALAWLQRGASAGSAMAAFWLGEFHQGDGSGSGGRTNFVEALRWYEHAASNGVRSAAFSAGELCARGQGTPPDGDRALRWLQMAADSGHVGALERLAGAYASGEFEPRGPEDRPVWLLRRAAVSRVTAFHAGVDAQLNRASMALVQDCRELWNRYRYGVGTARDYLAAAEWMWVAHQENLRRISVGLSSFTIDDRVLHPFDSILATPARTTEDRLWQRAVLLVKAAVEDGRAESWFAIGQSYRDGSELGPRQPPMARPWFVRASELGHTAAQSALRSLDGTLTPDELARARLYWVPGKKP